MLGSAGGTPVYTTPRGTSAHGRGLQSSPEGMGPQGHIMYKLPLWKSQKSHFELIKKKKNKDPFGESVTEST